MLLENNYFGELSPCAYQILGIKKDNLEFKNVVLSFLWNASEIKEIKK